MTNEEFVKIRNLLKSEYSFKGFLDTDEQNELWFNSFIQNNLSYQNVKDGCLMYIYDAELGSRQPHLNQIIDFAKKARTEYRLSHKKDDNIFSNTIRCRKCRDSGALMYYKGTDGHLYTRDDYYKQSELNVSIYEYMKPCDCKAGAVKFPALYGQYYLNDKGENQ